VDLADTDVVEDILFKLGDIGFLPESLLETDMEIIIGVNHISSPLVDSLVLHKKKLLPLALNNVTLTTLEPPMPQISTSDNLPTMLLPTLLPSKLKL